MGNVMWGSTQRGTEEEEETTASSQYRYPPKAGNFFSSHFIMGHCQLSVQVSSEGGQFLLLSLHHGRGEV